MIVKKIMNSLLNFIKKGKFSVYKLIMLIPISLLGATLCEYFIYAPRRNGYFSYDRVFILSCLIIFVGMHLIFNLKKMYNVIYKYRFIIALVILAICTVMGYSGSSINTYDSVIQSEVSDNSYRNIFGASRAIRTDEWAVNTPLSFSQEYDKYPYFNLNLRGTKTDMVTIINSPVNDIVTIGKPFNIGYLLFGNEHGLAFWWYGRLLALMLVSFELCMVLTKRNKLISLFGMIIISFSPAVQWWYSNFIVDILIFGQLFLVLLDCLLVSSKEWVKILCILGMGISIISYFFILYPAWMISFAYVYFAIFLWIVFKNKKNCNIRKRDIIYMLIVLIFIAAIIFRFFSISKDAIKLTLNTDYPGERFELGGGAKDNVFSYVYSIFMPFKNIDNPCEYSNMYSLYPIPMIISIFYLIYGWKKKTINNVEKIYIIALLLVSMLFSIWAFIPTNRIFAKITLLYMIPPHRCSIALGYSQILLIIFLLTNVKNNEILLNQKIKFVFSIFMASLVLYLAVKYGKENYLGPLAGYISGMLTFVLFYLLLNINRFKKDFMLVCGAAVIISGATVNPVIKGANVIYDKPVALKIQDIVKNDKDALWIVDNLNFTIPNYVVANGARVINSTNYYPNFDFYKKLLGDSYNDYENRKIYNRYAHITMNIDETDTNLELMYFDAFKINISLTKLKDIDAKYVISSRDLSKFSNKDIVFDNIYNEYGIYIFKIN